MTARQIVDHLLETDTRFERVVWTNAPKWAYRGISRKQLQSVVKHGLEPTTRVAIKHEVDRIGYPVIWFTSNPNYAESYAQDGYLIRFPWPKNAMFAPPWEPAVHTNIVSVPFDDEYDEYDQEKAVDNAIDYFVPLDDKSDLYPKDDEIDLVLDYELDHTNRDEWIIRHSIPPDKIQVKVRDNWISISEFKRHRLLQPRPRHKRS